MYHYLFVSCRLEQRLHSPLVEDFIAALEQLNSPELVWKVCKQTAFWICIMYVLYMLGARHGLHSVKGTELGFVYNHGLV